MPTKPINPNPGAAVGRLSLSTSDARGANAVPQGLGAQPGGYACFNAEASAVIFGCFGTSCFEGE
jgi:hypothetical protein